MRTRDTILTVTDLATLHALAACGYAPKSFPDQFVRSLVAQVDRGDHFVSRRQLGILWRLAYLHRRRLRGRPRRTKGAEFAQPLLF